MLISLDPFPDAAHLARVAVAGAVLALERPDLVDDATAVVSELVANVVIHARTQMTVSVGSRQGTVRIEVIDASPALPRSSPSPQMATSGRGLLLVQRLSARWGVDPLDSGGKVVWAELDEPASGTDDASLEDLLALWADESPASPAPVTPARLASITVNVDVEVQAMLESRVHTEDLVRELQLSLLNAARPVTAAASAPEVLRLARRLGAATEQFSEARRQMWNQTLAAAHQRLERATLRLQLHRGTGPQPGVGSRPWMRQTASPGPVSSSCHRLQRP